jgi:hypothetical protein
MMGIAPYGALATELILVHADFMLRAQAAIAALASRK